MIFIAHTVLSVCCHWLQTY